MDTKAALAENRARVEEFIAQARTTAATWTTPVRPGKWSPAEVAEHITISYRQTAGLMKDGVSDGFPKLPALLRPLVRRIAFAPVLKTGRFARPVKTFKSLTPEHPPATPDEAAARLLATLDAFEAAVRAMPADTVRHPAFGTISAADYVLFQAHHTRHHQAQLTA